MNSEELAQVISVAMEIATDLLSGVPSNGNFNDEVREKMGYREVDLKHEAAVHILAKAFFSYSHGVRLAERRGDPIPRVMGAD